MKKYKLITSLLFLSILFSTTSCEDFLNVEPKNQISRKEVLQKQQTYYDALNGVYLTLTSDELFGHQLTYGMIEQMSRNHSIKSNDPIFFWQYSSPEYKKQSDAIWDKMYFAIANINSVLSEIDNYKGLFDDGMYELLKGEFLTIRAHAHYTLLKLYAPDYNQNKTAKGIPYRTVFKYPMVTPFSTVEKVYEFILNDLQAAELLLKAKDPAVNGFGDFTTSVPNLVSGPSLMENRRLRFNYWGNLAIQARVYQSMNNFGKAAEYAGKIIAKEDIFKWVTQKDASSNSLRDVIYYSEVISGLQCSRLTTNYINLFTSEIYVTTQNKTDYLSKQIFESNTIGSFDYRLLYLFTTTQTIGTNGISKKYNQLNSSFLPVYDGYTLVPTVKLGEMYLIAAEANCHLSTDLTAAIGFVDKLRLQRGNVTKIDRAIGKEDLLDFILREYRRELYLEGQLFYQYKRHNLKSMPDLTALGYIDVRDETYIMPIPTVENDENN